MSRLLLLIRHARAEATQAGGNDQQRRLDTIGRDEARRAGDWLRQEGYLPDTILVSSATRTLETLDALRPFTAEPTIKVKPDMYLAPASTVNDCLSKLDASVMCAAVIGHNPGLMDLALSYATDDQSRAELIKAQFPTAGVAVFELTGDWQARRAAPGGAALRAMWRCAG